MWPRQEAIDFFTKRGEPLKVQLIEEKTAGQPQVSVYTIKDRDTFVDFCVGPHVPSTDALEGVQADDDVERLLEGRREEPADAAASTARRSSRRRSSTSTWRASRKRRSATTARSARNSACSRSIQWAPGATFWLPKGTTLYNTLSNYMRGVLIPAGYQEVKAPIVFNKALWQTSGHWDYYQDNMFLVKSSDGEEMGLKPMNCPGHFLLFGSEMRSYRDLPLRFHEQTPLHRNEASGTLSGLTRVRQFSQDDGHCFVMQEQIAAEVEALIKLVQRVYSDFGLSYAAKLSTRPEKFLGEVATWDDAEAAPEARARALAAGVHAERRRRHLLRPQDRLRHHGRARPEVAVRHDSARLPDARAVRPEIHGRRQRRAPPGRDSPRHLRQPRALHRASWSSTSPARSRCGWRRSRWWCCRSPTGTPITPGRSLAALEAAGLKAEVDDRQEKVNYKIREAQLQKVPYMLVVGDREAADRAVAVRSRSQGRPGRHARWTVRDRSPCRGRREAVILVIFALEADVSHSIVTRSGRRDDRAPHQRAHPGP